MKTGNGSTSNVSISHLCYEQGMNLYSVVLNNGSAVFMSQVDQVLL